MAKIGRPRIEIDEERIKELAESGCNNEEIAAIMGVSVDTLHRRFAEAIQKGNLRDYVSFRRRVREEAIGSPSKPNKANVGFAVLYAKLKGWYVERHETKNDNQNTNINREESLKEIEESVRLRLNFAKQTTTTQ